MSSASFLNDRVTLHAGDCLDVLRALPSNSIDACVTDPPYALVSIARRFGKDGAAPSKVPEGGSGAYARASAGFMGKAWDTGERAFAVEFWAEVYRVLKPGGHVLAFSATRTVHRLTCAIEDAGFEIRDMLAWLYGCLDDRTEVATINGVMPYHKTKVGDLVLCYDMATGSYSYQPVLEVLEYDYDDTAYRLVGDHGEQVVTRNHRCIVECSGAEVFCLAETLGETPRVPFLEDLPSLQRALHGAQQRADEEEGVRPGLLCRPDRSGAGGCDEAACRAQGSNGALRGLSGGGVEARSVAQAGVEADLQSCVQWSAARGGVEGARSEGRSGAPTREHRGARGSDDRPEQPGVEGWSDLSEKEGGVCGSADTLRALSGRVPLDGTGRRVRDGAPPRGGASGRPTADAHGDGASHQPSRNGECRGQPDAVCDQRTAQGLRAWGGHRASLVRVVPFRLVGKVWCLRVPTGAFVAVRDGVAFPTGNSGFPKSHDVAKGIDKAAGAEREVVGQRRNNKGDSGTQTYAALGAFAQSKFSDVTAPATDAARQWEGWGTALKPALEPITLARKPLDGTVAENVLAHGTGALNIAGCRVATPDELRAGAGVLWSHQRKGEASAERRYTTEGSTNFAATPGPRGGSPDGRWPANVLHDGSAEVVAAFPEAPGQQRSVGPEHGAKSSVNVYGDYGARDQFVPRGDGGSAARFFYSAKADSDDRIGSKHPTVKPVDLMRWLVRLVTPPGGTVLDPFAGTGTTGEAAFREGFSAVLVEREAEYRADIARRMELVLAGPDGRKHAIAKAKAKPDDMAGTLFAPLLTAAE